LPAGRLRTVVCTLVFAWQVFADAPLVAAANRDEATDRPSVPPRRLEDDPVVVAPQDEEAGGTWIGVNEHGLFVALTNRWVDVQGERSRGLLVREALRQHSAEDAARFVEREAEPGRYAGFNLVAADADAAVYAEWDGRLSVRHLRPGVHVVVNVGSTTAHGGPGGDFFVPEARPDAGRRQAENAGRLAAALRPEPGETADAWRDRAADTVGDHEFGVCVHGDGFGTRSSSLVTVHDDGLVEFAFADGPPCRTDYEPVAAAAALGGG
jgi:hypothetical protein